MSSGRTIKRACLAVRAGYSPDRIVADPELNAVFIRECRRLHLRESSLELNARLINLRKSGNLRGLKSKRTSFRDQDAYLFASEIAMRFLERRDGVTLDEVICDPHRVAEFDEVAARIAPGYSPLRYRWAALYLRKNRRLKPEPLGHALPAVEVKQHCVDGLRLDDIPDTQGLYVFFDGKKCLYVGETKNLRNRLGKHLEFSDNRGLAHWLWAHGSAGLMLETHVLDLGTPTRTRKAMELELIRSRKPVFNIAGT